LDELGLKGFRVGDAMVSDRHANFFVNTGHASCADMLALIETVRDRVFAAHGLELEREVIFWEN
jgi:UDP-N-acetylmuramate dehydrogenase